MHDIWITMDNLSPTSYPLDNLSPTTCHQRCICLWELLTEHLPHPHTVLTSLQVIWVIIGVPGGPELQAWSRLFDYDQGVLKKTFHPDGIQALAKWWDKCGKSKKQQEHGQCSSAVVRVLGSSCNIAELPLRPLTLSAPGMLFQGWPGFLNSLDACKKNFIVVHT